MRKGLEKKDFLENSGKKIIKILYARSSVDPTHQTPNDPVLPSAFVHAGVCSKFIS